MRAVFARRSVESILGTLLLIALSLVVFACGTPSTPTPTTPAPTPTPSQPSFPSTPPVPITWSSASTLPAPIAQDPANSTWGKRSNDFPLTVSNPTAAASMTSPINVVALATPKNSIFFGRRFVDNVSVYYTSSNSINTQIFTPPGKHTMVVMAEDSRGYVSAIPDK